MNGGSQQGTRARCQDGPHPRSAAKRASHYLRKRGDDGSWGRAGTNLLAQATAPGETGLGDLLEGKAAALTVGNMEG